MAQEKEGLDFNPTEVVEQPLSRAEKRRQKRAEAKRKHPPKYGPVIIFREVYEEVHEEGQKGVKFKKNYQGRTNIKGL